MFTSVQRTQEQHLVGFDYLNAVTRLLRRARNAHPTAGLLESADLQWWWRSPRSTDQLPQLFWFDASNQPVAAVIATDWGDGVVLDPIFMPDAKPDWVAHVIERGLTHAQTIGLNTVDFVVDSKDSTVHEALVQHGFANEADQSKDGATSSLSVLTAWLAATKRPAVSPLYEGYRLVSRADVTNRPHHMIEKNGAEVEARLLQTSMYRADLDLFVLDQGDNVAAYALFWLDPETKVGLVEPMRTEIDHRQRGLARHLLTAGIDRLVNAGATRMKLCFKPDKVAAEGLYLSAGFITDKLTTAFVR
jgi:Acetyltransferase (GNAT) family